MYALVTIKGKQYKAEKGKKLIVDLYDAEVGAKLDFPALLVSSEAGVKVGSPYVEGVKVSATVQDSFRDKKVMVFKYLRRKGYRRNRGHRQSYTTLLVNSIG
ncbi:MAG: 50S ribosomal protein L21 [Spirochaetaceae bacterium]|nr:50S ribosomal protein L21 [Spirochaetaceae bacterium]